MQKQTPPHRTNMSTDLLFVPLRQTFKNQIQEFFTVFSLQKKPQSMQVGYDKFSLYLTYMLSQNETADFINLKSLGS